jgi:hypothetical protein
MIINYHFVAHLRFEEYFFVRVFFDRTVFVEKDGSQPSMLNPFVELYSSIFVGA